MYRNICNFYSNSNKWRNSIISVAIKRCKCWNKQCNLFKRNISKPLTPSVAIVADNSTICTGTSVTFTATPTNGGIPIYQWKLNGANVGINSATYSNGTLANH